MIIKKEDKMSQEIFKHYTSLESDELLHITDHALQGLDDGDLYIQYEVTSAVSLEDGTIKTAAYDISQGFGFRGIMGEKTVFSQSSSLDLKAIKEASSLIQDVRKGYYGKPENDAFAEVKPLYGVMNETSDPDLQNKIDLLKKADSYARQNPLVKQVSARVSVVYEVVGIFKSGGRVSYDVRPLMSCHVSVMVERQGRREAGSYGFGGREGFSHYVSDASLKKAIDHAIEKAVINLDAKPAPAGEMTVVLGSGWPGILLHEAVGHGLEGDFNRKKTSAFSDRIGEKVAFEGITVVDDGTLAGRRGSLSVDDEGTTTECTTLIENGILKGYMQDRLNARLMGAPLTGNGRRESYACLPMPRMTNTYMLNGEHQPEDIIKSVDKGIYATDFGGGQVDITNGKFVFSCTLAYEIENGKIGAPLKGATLIGNGPDVLTKVSMVGNDMALDPGVGTCGKNGQSVPVGVGQPTLKINGLIVGGTEAS